jgi:hypothetical protein
MLYSIFIESVDDAIEYLIECNFLTNVTGNDILYSINFIRMIDINVIDTLNSIRSIGLLYLDDAVPTKKLEEVYRIYVNLQMKYGGL